MGRTHPRALQDKALDEYVPNIPTNVGGSLPNDSLPAHERGPCFPAQHLASPARWQDATVARWHNPRDFPKGLSAPTHCHGHTSGRNVLPILVEHLHIPHLKCFPEP